MYNKNAIYDRNVIFCCIFNVGYRESVSDMFKDFVCFDSGRNSFIGSLLRVHLILVICLPDLCYSQKHITFGKSIVI